MTACLGANSRRAEAVNFYRAMMEDPVNCAGAPFDLGFLLTPQERSDIYLAGIRRHFAYLQPKVRVLGRLASELGIRDIESLDTVVPLLFPHTVYKSYPLSWIDQGRFNSMTEWLADLTAVDLSEIRCDGITSIDDWIEHLARCSELLVTHTFGTTGKPSFIPKTIASQMRGGKILRRCVRDWNGAGSGPDFTRTCMPVVQPTYRYGATGGARSMDALVRFVAGGEGNAIFLYPAGRLSADVASFAGRLRTAEARGERTVLNLSATLQARMDAFRAFEEQRPAAMDRFFEEIGERIAGKDVCIYLFTPLAFDWAEEGMRRGFRSLFGPGSVLITGGGTKGRQIPENWRERLAEFLGFDNYIECYSMTEAAQPCPRCAQGNYHISPMIVPFVLDPMTGEPLPRTGRCTGRYAVFDLNADSYWAGVITGDEVTVVWDTPCECGRLGPYMEPTIRRYSEQQGGTDKISCAGATEAHDHLLASLVSGIGG